MSAMTIFDDYLALWDLTPDGEPIVTATSRLLPVRRGGKAAMLKLAFEAEERFSAPLLSWWDGDGAARLLAMQESAILIERAEGERSLSAMARGGRDEEATRILCDAIAALHRPRARPHPTLIPLMQWFAALEPAAAAQGGLLMRSNEAARRLLADPREEVMLHGDAHHDNILDFGARGWLAIDPKGLYGERAFDYAILFCDPDLADPSPPVAIRPEIFAARLAIVAEHASLERSRLLDWIIAWTGLSAAWFIGDGLSAEIDLRVAAMAVAERDRC
jgi:streptomycin 6-kinase